MAILASIRSKGIFLIIIIALALFAFIIGDLIRQGGFSSDDQNTIGVVGDTDITREAFNRQVQNLVKQRPGTSELQAANTVWNQEVRNAVLKTQIDAAGIEVSDQEVSDYIKNQYANFPLFQDESGTFSETKLYQWIEDQKKTNPSTYRLWKADVENAAEQVKQNQFFNLLKSGIIGTNADGKMEYKLANDARSFSYVNIPYTSIADSTVAVSKAEIKEYLKAHEGQYKTEAQRDLSFVVFEDKASNMDRLRLKEDMISYVNDTDVFNKNLNITETRVGLKNTKTPVEFVNSYSEQAYSEDYILASKLPVAAQEIKDLEEGEVFGPFEDNGYMKASRMMNKKVIMDSVKNRHILVAYSGAQRANPDVTRSKEDAQRIADSIFNIIGQSSSRFEDKFDYFTDNTDLAKGEDLGWVVYTGNARNFAKGFTEFLYDNKEGTIGVAESSFGYHIIRIDETKTPLDAYQLATIVKKINASKETGDDLYNQAQKFERAARDGDFTEVAGEFNVTAKPVASLKPLDETLPGLKRNREIVKWAFDEERKVGDLERFETTEGFVVAKLERKADKGLMNVEDASAQVTPILRNKKKAQMIMDKITGSDINAVAQANSVQVKLATDINRKSPTIPGVGEEPVVVGTAFGLDLNATSKPIKGEKGVFIIKLSAINDAPELPNYNTDAREVASRTANQSTSQLVEALKKSMDIDDRRASFF